jgi:hypothetical protein
MTNAGQGQPQQASAALFWATSFVGALAAAAVVINSVEGPAVRAAIKNYERGHMAQARAVTPRQGQGTPALERCNTLLVQFQATFEQMAPERERSAFL